MNADKQLAELIKKSGNQFHCSVIRHLREAGWHVTVSPYYMDEAANKPREIDIIAERYWEGHPEFGQAPTLLVIRLFIECKYILDYNVFWFEERDAAKSMDLVLKKHGLRENNAFTNKHHYLAGSRQVAKLFASQSNAQTENQPIYKALNQCLNGMIYLRILPSKIPEQTGRNWSSKRKVDLPIILCHSFDKVYMTSMDGSSNIEKAPDLFQLEVNYAFVSPKDQSRYEEYFLIDVLNFQNFDSYLGLLEEDKEIIMMFMQ